MASSRGTATSTSRSGRRSAVHAAMSGRATRGTRLRVPPGFVLETNQPVGTVLGRADQPVAPPFFLGVRRIRARGALWAPVFGTLPADTEPPERLADRLVADPLCRNALFSRHLGHKRQRPDARRFAELAGRAVQQFAQVLAGRSIEGDVDRVRTTRARLQTLQPVGVEGVEDGARPLVAAAQAVCDVAGSVATGTGQQDLATPEDGGVMPRGHPAQTVLKSLALAIRKWTDKDWA